MSHPTAPILLVGFSARMLAELAVKAGYQVLALDYFGDTDLQQRCPSLSLKHDFNVEYSATALVDASKKLAGSAVVYGAGLENHPAAVERLAQKRQLLGNSQETLRQVRNPFRLAAALKAGGFAFPETLSVAQAPDNHSSRRWLWKPLRGGGGVGVKPWSGTPPPQPGIVQELLPGLVGSAAFVANGRQAVLLGVTEQLAERQTFGATGFKYCGNLVPPRLRTTQLAALVAELHALTNHLTKIFALRGINGLDFVWHQERVWMIEINPRFTASLELIDTSYGLRIFDLHVRAFAGQLPDFSLTQALTRSSAAGKAILYAPDDVTMGDTGHWSSRGIKDIPHSGELVRQGHPVCTILTTGATPTDCLQQLRLRADELKQEFQIFSGGNPTGSAPPGTEIQKNLEA